MLKLDVTREQTEREQIGDIHRVGKERTPLFHTPSCEYNLLTWKAGRIDQLTGLLQTFPLSC